MVTTFPATQDMPEPTRLTPEKRYAMELTQHIECSSVDLRQDIVAFGHQNLLCTCKLRSFIYYIAHMIWYYNL